MTKQKLRVKSQSWDKDEYVFDTVIEYNQFKGKEITFKGTTFGGLSLFNGDMN